MSDQDSDTQNMPSVDRLTPQESLRAKEDAGLFGAPRVIRYMDDGVFQSSLDEVVRVHGRLLAKLAE